MSIFNKTKREIITIHISKYLMNELSENIAKTICDSTDYEYVDRLRNTIFDKVIFSRMLH